MKTLISSLIFTFALVLTSCEKEKTPASEYITYEFKIVSAKKQIPLANYYLFFYQSTWLDNKRFTDSIIGYYKTDEQGELKFTFKASDITHQSNVKYYLENYYPDSLTFDSNNVNFKYDVGIQIFDNTKKTIEARCNCSIRITLNQEKYMAMGIDSLYLETPFEKYVNKDDTELYYVHGDLECSENVPLKYYYYVKGIKSKEYTKDIFISRANPFTGKTVYELEF